MITKVHIKDNKNSPIHYLSNIEACYTLGLKAQKGD